MADLKTRLLPLFRRSSASSAKVSETSSPGLGEGHRNRSKTSLLLTTRGRRGSLAEAVPEEEDEAVSPVNPKPADFPAKASRGVEQQQGDREGLATSKNTPEQKHTPAVTLEEATPQPLKPVKAARDEVIQQPLRLDEEDSTNLDRPQHPQNHSRRQSLSHSNPTRSVRTLLEADSPLPQPEAYDYFAGASPYNANMLRRKVWVKRPGQSATLVVVGEDDLVDDVRDFILRKYANSLGRNFDAPDVTLRIVPRDQSHRHSQGERTLGPEEPISRTLDSYYPGGQTVDEALLIDVPQRRTPRPSPRVPMPYYIAEDGRPGEAGAEYFPPMAAGASSPHHPSNMSVGSNAGINHGSHPISVMSAGYVPPLPSPGSRVLRHPHTRPKYGRANTQSPIVSSVTSVHLDNRGLYPSATAVPQPLPTPPLPAATQRSSSPPPRITSPRPAVAKRNSKKNSRIHPNLPKGVLDGAVPPINVLIVEDNIINLKLLEAFMKRLKVRWHTAMNGREAVNKWRAGGFHLVLMDIQLPVMNGLEATKEIRRLERVNGVGVMAACMSGRSSVTGQQSVDGDAGEDPADDEGIAEEDRLMNTELFKSPVIIVALTASSLQSDRHEALAAGCNDFLTKPVSYVWLERKVMEWGCMQALIDFDGWRKWKDFSANPVPAAPAPIPPKLVNNSSGSTVASVSSVADSPRPTTAKRAVEGTRVVEEKPPPTWTSKKAKRSSLGRKGLSGVLEDSAEGGEREIVAGA